MFIAFDGGSAEGFWMVIRKWAAGSAAVLAVCAGNSARAQSASERLPEIVVTADRTPTPLSQTGSAISVPVS